METKLERIASKSANTKRPEFTSLYHLINKELLMQCHKEVDGNKAVGIDEITKREYSENLEGNIENLVDRLKRKSYKPMPSLRVYIPKSNGKMRPLGIACYEDKIVQLALKKILEAIYEPKFLNCMHGFRANRRCHTAVKELYDRINIGKITRVVDADIKGFFDNIDHEVMVAILKERINDERFMEMSADYEAEQRELKEKAAALQGELDKAQEATVNAEKFMNVVRKYLSIEELTHTLLREMVEKIVVYECEYDENEVRHQRIDIYYSFVGKIDLPEE